MMKYMFLLRPAATWLLTGLCLMSASSASAQVLNGDLILVGAFNNQMPTGINPWIFQTGGGGQLVISPLTNGSSPTAGWSPVNGSWSYSTYFKRNGDVQFQGRVGIGTDPLALPVGAITKLAVEGLISARSIRVVAVGAPWPDYVFAPAYALRPLGDVADFIATNHHLPDMPSAAEVEKDGLDLGAMNARLLRKVEELTLYLLQMEQQNAALRARVSALETTSGR